MGWSIGYVGGRDVGYGVPATCEYPTCKAIIDRGLSYACGGFPDSEYGCGLFFCGKHMTFANLPDSDETVQCCDRCAYRNEHPDADWRTYPAPYEQKPDRPVWIRHKLKHSSWQQWRDENPDEVKQLTQLLPTKAKGEE